MIPKSIQTLIEQLAKLPTIGPKTAERLTFYLLKQDTAFLNGMGNAIINAKQGIVLCKTCLTFAEAEQCAICADPHRDHSLICVVEDFLDYVAIEKAKSYNGVYHVLHGSIAPLQGIGPRQLKIQELENRLNTDIQEVILATNPTMEGEATAMYLKKTIADLQPSIKISRLAKGLPMGGDIEYADDVTISNSLNQRTIY